MYYCFKFTSQVYVRKKIFTEAAQRHLMPDMTASSRTILDAANA